MTNLDAGDIRSILLKLEEDDLFSLAKTVTQGLKRSNTKDEAMENIIKYSADVLSILRRKAVTREILFSYLDDRNIKVRLPTTKNEIIDKIMELWHLPKTSTAAQCEGNSNDGESSHDTLTFYSDTVQESKDNITLLAEKFAEWFYSMLNQNECIGSEHFYPDAKFKLNLYINEDCDTTVIENDPEEIRNIFLRTKIQYKLFYNPNVTKEGIRGYMDPHGLVIVLCCGTLHVENTCAGIFEQVFSLARDPSCDNNWKIKNTELNLRSKSNISGPPMLCDSELTSKLLILEPK